MDLRDDGYLILGKPPQNSYQGKVAVFAAGSEEYKAAVQASSELEQLWHKPTADPMS